MATNIAGKLLDGAGKPVPGCTIQLKAKKTSPTVVAHIISSNVTGNDGAYLIAAENGYYGVTLLREGYKPEYVGDIYVSPTDKPDTLNAFLDAPKDADLRPETMKRFEAMVNQVVSQSAQVAVDAKSASDSAVAANASKTAASTSATNAATSATAAKASETAASTSATNAATSATAAKASETASASSASSASTYATNALASKNAAATSATNAANSATSIGNAEANALASKNAAAASATNAASSASAAATSATNAAGSASSASTSATNAASSAGTAATSAGSATSSAASAEDSATRALASKNAAKASETNAANSASSIGSAEANALASQRAAEKSATDAAASASSALTAASRAESAEEIAIEKANVASQAQSSASSSANTASQAMIAVQNSTATVQQLKDETVQLRDAAFASAGTASAKASEASSSANTATQQAQSATQSAASAKSDADRASQIISGAQKPVYSSLPLSGDGTVSNPLNVKYASQSAYGVTRYSTPAESITLTADNISIPPSGLSSALQFLGLLNTQDSSATVTDLNNAKTSPMYAYGGMIPANWPITGATGNDSQGVVIVVPRGFYVAQIVITYTSKMFYRVFSNAGWQPWVQVGGAPLSGGVGSYMFAQCSSANVAYDANVAGSTLKPASISSTGTTHTPASPPTLSGTWSCLGVITAASDVSLFVRIS